MLDLGSADRGQLAHHAVEREQDVVLVLDMLVARGAPLDEPQYARHSRSWNHEFFKDLGTPLHRATELGKFDVIQYLLKNNVNRDIRDSKNRTPLDIAKGIGHECLVSLLDPC